MGNERRQSEGKVGEILDCVDPAMNVSGGIFNRTDRDFLRLGDERFLSNFQPKPRFKHLTRRGIYQANLSWRK